MEIRTSIIIKKKNENKNIIARVFFKTSQQFRDIHKDEDITDYYSLIKPLKFFFVRKSCKTKNVKKNTKKKHCCSFVKSEVETNASLPCGKLSWYDIDIIILQADLVNNS